MRRHAKCPARARRQKSVARLKHSLHARDSGYDAHAGTDVTAGTAAELPKREQQTNPLLALVAEAESRAAAAGFVRQKAPVSKVPVAAPVLTEDEDDLVDYVPKINLN